MPRIFFPHSLKDEKKQKTKVFLFLKTLFKFTRASCCLVRPPFRSSSNRLPTTGQLVGPGMSSRLCALDAACGQRAASAASFSSRTHTEDVGLKCCSPKDFFFSTSTIWGTFWICALIVETTRKKAFLRTCVFFFVCVFFVPLLQAALFFVISGFLVSWKCHIFTPIYIPPDCSFLPCTEPIRGRPCVVWTSSPPFIYGSTLGRIA